MKRKNNIQLIKLIYYLLIPFISLPVIAQQTLPAIYNNGETYSQTGPCVTKEEMDHIKSNIAQSKKRLEAEGKLSANRVQAFGAHSFRWPLAPATNNYNLGCYYISNYVDLNPVSIGNPADSATHSLEDYNCGTRTYDVNLGSYDHSGIDIGIGPFSWKMMDTEGVDVVAAESGYISAKQDGLFDRTCKTGVPGNGSGNHISVTHSDGSTTIYMHMKSGTLTGKEEDDIVQVGEYLGKVGSSGNSSGPHLHFEVHDDLGIVRDPFQNGNCNSGDNSSLWSSEEPYYNRKIISIFTLSAPWTNATCDTNGNSHGYSEVVSYKNHFNPGDPIYFSAGVRDYTALLPIQLKVLNTSGTAIYSNTFSYSYPHAAYYNVPAQFLLAPSTTGTYKVECTYNGITRAHYFTVGCPGSITLASTRSSNYGKISGGYIASTDVISASARNVQYQAEDYIQLNEGFIATDGCEFLARIDNCTVGGTKYEEQSLENDRKNFSVKIFPNPFSTGSTLEIDIARDEIISVAIYDLTGRSIKTISENRSLLKGNHKFSIDGSGLQQGMYQCIITCNDGNKIIERMSVIK
ncbi:MAG TPA: peptidoglycan DD-metalloendopeptidase family protein [Bacteroidia bacterium]|nr:peptidoglycan DD-metalloendopeptidase family protein [Bacteroidia bacterium]